MTTAAKTRAARWIAGPVLLPNGSTIPGWTRGNMGLFFRRESLLKSLRWVVVHQPSGLGFFRADTRRIALDVLSHVEQTWGLEFCDRYARSEQTPDDERIGDEVRAYILSQPRTGRR